MNDSSTSSESTNLAEAVTPLLGHELDDLLTKQMTGFVRYARENRFKLGVAENLDCQKLAASIGIVNKRYLKHALKGLMCSDNDDWERFDRLFDLYWQHEQGKRSAHATTGGSGERDKSMPADNRQPQGAQAGGGQYDVPDTTGIANDEAIDGNLSQDGASAAEALERTNFRQLNNAAVQAATSGAHTQAGSHA